MRKCGLFSCGKGACADVVTVEAVCEINGIHLFVRRLDSVRQRFGNRLTEFSKTYNTKAFHDFILSLTYKHIGVGIADDRAAVPHIKHDGVGDRKRAHAAEIHKRHNNKSGGNVKSRGDPERDAHRARS